MADKIDRTEIDRRLRGIFADLFGVDPASLTADSSPDNIENWDSLQHLNLVTGVESEFGITLSDEHVIDMLSFGLVVEIVAGALEGR